MQRLNVFNYLSSFLLLMLSLMGAVAVKAFEDLEKLSLVALRTDDILPLLIRGGSIDSTSYHNGTFPNGPYLCGVDTDPGYGYSRASRLYHTNQPHTTTHENDSMRRRIPGKPQNPDINSLETNSAEEEKVASYTDILQCKSQRWIRSSETERVEGRNFRRNDSDSNSFGSREYSNSRGVKTDRNQRLPHSPVVYQYYGRSRMRGNPSQSLHFILLGPNVDHWKAVGQTLASRGFNAIACERVQDANGGNIDRSQDAPNLVLDILDALKWDKVVLVGCDKEAMLAMETAMMLEPDQVAGLILSGDLTEASRIASEAGVQVLDTFLRRILDCPFLIVWDGDSPSIVSGSSAHEAIASDSDSTCQILGGGSAPHRTKPEQFAWILTRFVEERLEIPSQRDPRLTMDEWRRANWNKQVQGNGPNLFQLINLPFGVNTLFSPEGRLLLGRAVAAAVFYITIMKVAVIQYGLLRAGLMGIKSKYDSVDAVLKRIFQATGAFIINYGYIPRLFSVKKAAEDDDDNGRVDNTVVISHQSQEENAKQQAEVESSNAENDDISDGTEEKVPPKTENGDEDKVTTGDVDDSIDKPPPTGENERARFKPFFFLDSVVT